MKIASSNVNMSASHQKVEAYHKEENLSFFSRRPGGTATQIQYSSSTTALSASAGQAKFQSSLGEPITNYVNDQLEISDAAREQLANRAANNGNTANAGALVISSPNIIGQGSAPEGREHEFVLLKKMLEFLTGKKFDFAFPKALDFDNKQTDVINNMRNRLNNTGWEINYNMEESFYRAESMTFATDGMVTTADGRTINFSLELNMSREFAYHNQISFQAGNRIQIDPLIINYAGNLPNMTERKYQFDLDVDGQLDNISFAGAGSGFLAWDKNDDGIINDGSELFGPATGNGFLELAQYDEDGNGWIDENDSIYNQLVVWTKDEQGNDQLFALGDLDIGAIYLGHVATDYELRDAQQNSQGTIAQSGVFLKDSGGAGTIHHVDITL